MAFVMITMSVASGRRIAEVLSEVPTILNPENPVTEVADGSVDFDNVNFGYGKRKKLTDWDNPEEVAAMKRRARLKEAVRSGKMTAAEAIAKDPQFRAAEKE